MQKPTGFQQEDEWEGIGNMGELVGRKGGKPGAEKLAVEIKGNNALLKEWGMAMTYREVSDKLARTKWN